MLSFKENPVNYTAPGELTLYYCGVREKSLNHRYGPHRFNTYILNYVVEGSATFHIDGQLRTISAGQFYTVFPQSEVHYTTAPNVPWSIRWIVVGGEQVAEFLSSLGVSEHQPVINVQQRDKIQQIYQSLFEYSNRKTPADKLRCLSLVYRLFALLTQEITPAAHNAYILKALDYFSEHFCEPISINTYAKEQLGLNNNYFSKLFKSETGVTPLHYIQQLRFEKAQHLLTHTDLSVEAVATEVGVSDMLYFSRIFKQYTGFSPTAYRKMTGF